MLLVPCPHCGPRPEIEFTYGGQAGLKREGGSDSEWTDLLYFRANPRGLHEERWRHTMGCGRFFNVTRNTVTDQFA